jgi:putative MATE family efflux protein
MSAATLPTMARAEGTASGRSWRSPHDREILRLAIPALGALVAEPLFLLADTAIVGHLGTSSLAALGIAGAALSTLVNLCVFLAYGTTAAVARQLGAGDLRTALAQGIDGLWLAASIGVVVAAATAALTPQIVHAFGASDAVSPLAETFLLISTIGIPPMLVVLAATGVLRGLQDTRTPLVIFVAGAIANVVLNVVLVYGVDLGIAGSALGTVITQWGMAAVLATVVVRGARRHQAALRPDRRGILAAGHSGVPLFVRTLTLRAALLATTYVATQQGDVALAAHQVAFTLWTFLAFVLDAIAIAGQAITGRALGASDVVGTRAATRRMIAWGLATGVVAGLLLLVCRPLLLPLFSTDPAVRSAMFDVLLVAALLQPVSGVVFVLDGVLIGAGDGRFLAVAGVITLVVYLPLVALVLATDAGLVALWFSFGGFMLARMITLVWRERTDAWLVTGAQPMQRTVQEAAQEAE